MSEAQFQKVIKSRASKHSNEGFKYFWLSFVMQIILYAVLCHLFIRHFGNYSVMLPAALGILVYIPFTVVLMRKFKSIAVLKDSSIKSYIQKQYDLLNSFYRFKLRYELLSVPLTTMVCIALTFELTVPGGVIENFSAASAVFVVSIIACIASVKHENEKRFDIPLSNLRLILKDMNAD